jgi:hypothetical protein
VRDGALFGAFSAGQVLSCIYYGCSCCRMAVVCGATLIAERRLPKDRILALAVARRSRSPR